MGKFDHIQAKISKHIHGVILPWGLNINTRDYFKDVLKRLPTTFNKNISSYSLVTENQDQISVN